MLLTPKTTINRTTKKANRFPPTTTIASRLKINDNDPLHYELPNVPNAKTITLFTPPLAEGEHYYKPRIKQSGQTAGDIFTTDINGPGTQYGPVRSASRQPELNCYHTTAIVETNEYSTYPHGDDTEGGVIKEGYATPVLAKKVEPPEDQTMMAMAITCASIFSNGTLCHHGEETEGVAKIKHSVPVLKRLIEPPERGITNTLESPTVPPDKPTTFQRCEFHHYGVMCKAKRKVINGWSVVRSGQNALLNIWRTVKQRTTKPFCLKVKWALHVLLQIQLWLQCPLQRLLQRLLWLLQRLLQFSLQLLRLLLLLLQSISITISQQRELG